jgi:EmrB/QacA subfamily drug resistance transporter
MNVSVRHSFRLGGWPALATLCAVLFLTFLDNTIVSVSLADIQTTLHSGVAQLQWIVDGYMLAFAGLMLTGGTLGDLFGRKRVMLAGVVAFCVGSLVAALASDNAVLIGGRVLMGIGAAASEPGTLSMIRHVYPERAQRARALGAWTAVSGAALALGPIIGGLLVAGVGWRGVFWFNLAFGALAFLAAAAVLPESADPQGRRLDLSGLVLGAAAMTAATFAVIEGESAGYTAWWIDLLFAAAALAAVAFVVVERRSPDPVLKLELFRNRTFSVANLAAFATSFGIFAVFFFTALYLQLIGNFSGWKIALQFLAMAVAIVVAASAAGRWTARSGPRQPLTVGCVLAGAGLFAVNALLGRHVPFGALACALAVAGLGFGLALVAVTAAVLAVVPAARSGMAASTLNTSRQLGGVFGVAILGALVNAQLTASLTHKLQQLGIPANFQAIVINAVTHGGLPTSPAGVHNPAAAGHQTLVAQVIKAAEDAFASGLHLSLLVAAVILLGTAAVSLLTLREPARQPLSVARERLHVLWRKA